MIKPAIAIIINSFNRLPLLKECLKALSWIPNSQFKDECVIVVYDAGSTDGSLEWLKDKEIILGVRIDLVVPKDGEDTSFSAGLNAGVNFAMSNYSSLKYLLFYETDNQILESAPLSQALVELEKRENLAACGFTVRKHNGEPAGVGQPFPTLLNFALGKNIVFFFQLEAIPFNWKATDCGGKFSNVDIVYTSPLLVRLDAWKASGGLDAQLFPFSDCDVDWAKRLRNLGWKMGVISSDKVIHDNLDTASGWSKTRAIQNHRGRLRYFRRHHPVSVFTIWPVLLMLRHSLELIVTKLLVREPLSRHRLSSQFLNLLKSCPNSYE